MNRPSIEDLVAGMEDVATLPATIVDLLRLLDNPSIGAEKVQVVLERDVAMTANILKLGNSAYYGSRKKISSVRQAIVLLGNRSVATLAFAAGMAPIMRRDLECYNLSRDDFWDHALVSAAASSLAADQLGNSHLRCEAFSVGLIHDVGMLIIDNWLSLQDQPYELSGKGYGDFSASEQDLLGFDHAEVGASLAQRWGFPDIFTQVIAHHHERGDTAYVSGDIGSLICAVSAGNLMAGLIARDMNPEKDLAAENSPNTVEIVGKLESLGIDADSIEQLCLDLTDNLEETLTSATRCPVLN